MKSFKQFAVEESKNTYKVSAETGPHQYSDMEIKAKDPKEAEKIFRKSYKHPMGLTVKQVKEEASPTSTVDVVGTGDDVADWKTKKKKKSSVVTRHYIEVNGKRKKQMKESLQEAYPRAQLLDNIKDDILSALDDIDPSYLKPEMLKDPKEINKEIEGYYEYNMGSGPGYKVKDVAGVLKKHHKEFLKFIKNKKQSK